MLNSGKDRKADGIPNTGKAARDSVMHRHFTLDLRCKPKVNNKAIARPDNIQHRINDYERT